MKTILAISVMAVLATGVIVPSFQDAYALATKADKEKLSPKAFGDKTKTKLQYADSTHKTGFESVKKEQVKTFKKIAAEDKAKELLKQLYGL